MRVILTVALLFAVTACGHLNPADTHWISDMKTGCRMFNPYPAGNEAVTWSGSCEQNLIQGMGVQQWFLDGKPNGQYEGEMKDGRYDGHGSYVNPGGDVYIGQHKDGFRNGWGTRTEADGTKYVGEFKNDKYNGHGTLTSDGSSFVGEFKDDDPYKGIFTLPTGEKIAGEFRDGKLLGQCVISYPNGDVYVGHVDRDIKPHGQGTRKSASGTTIYSGVWNGGDPVK